MPGDAPRGRGGYDSGRLNNGSSAPTFDHEGTPVRVDPSTGKVSYPSSGANNGRPEVPTLIEMAHAGGTSVDLTGYNFLKDRINPDNPWFKMQNQLLDQQHGQALNQNARSTRNAMTGGLNQLAASGGFDAGARERMARGVQSQGMLGAQQLSGTNMQNRLNLGIQNEQMSRQAAGQFTGMDMDIARLNMQKHAMDNSNKMDMYNTQMTAWGADKTANAMAKGGKKG